MKFSAAPSLLPSAAAEPSPSRSRIRRVFVFVALSLVAVFYLWFVRHHSAYIASASDASGYFNVARLLRSGELIQTVPRLESLTPPAWDYLAQQPLGFTVDRARGTMVTTYSPGLPLHFLVAAPFVGLDYAPLAVNVFLAAAAAALTLALGRQLGLRWSWAVAAVGVLWACPLYLLHALQPMTDACAMVWTMAAISAALQTRRHRAWGFAVGASVAVAVLVRPSNLLLLLPVAAILRLHVRAWFAVILGGLPGAAFLAWYNLKLYGAVLTTGYGNVESAFSLGFVPHNAAHFAFWLCALLSPLIALTSLGLPLLWRESRAAVVLLSIWAATFLGFYLFYFHSGETWWYLRFILPMFPALIFSALLVAQRFFARRAVASPSHWLPPLLLVVVLAWEFVATDRLQFLHIKRGDTQYLSAARWMQQHAPANAVVLEMQLSGSFTYYTTFAIVRYDMLDAAAWKRLQDAAPAARRPIYAALFDFEETEAFTHCPAEHWTRETTFDRVSVWRLDPSLANAPVSSR